MKKTEKNPWTPQDEGDHFPVMKEWWCFETLFKTIKDNRKWNLKLSMAYQQETPSCFYNYYLFDITNNKLVFHKALNDDINKFKHKKEKVDLKYEKTTAKGLYPNYEIHLEEPKKDFTADLKFKAKIFPHWSAQDATNGYLPIGFDHYRYGWLLNCDLTGKIKIKNEILDLKGKGYLERAYGNWSYKNPFTILSNLKKTINTYGKLSNWWISQHKPKIPNKISFTTENNPFGYDWFWSVFENDWSVFYGNSMLWVKEGPSFGVLTLFKDLNNYIDFSDIKFKYNKSRYLPKYDLYYPIDLTINAKKDDKKLNIRAWATCNGHEYEHVFKNSGFYKAFYLCELPGKIKAEYEDKNKKVNLKGDCKLVQQRQVSLLGHNSLTLKVIKPPKGIGFNFDLDSHFMKKRIKTKINLASRKMLNFSLKKY